MHRTGSREEWLRARRELLEQEKEHTRRGDELAQKLRELPWVKVEKNYVFRSPQGEESLGDLFGGRGQLIVYHFMFDPEWEEGCKSCSFMADHFEPAAVHLSHRDTALVAVSRAPLKKLEAYRERMGWSFRWASSFENSFNRDFQVSFTPEELDSGEMTYNFRRQSFPSTEAPGLSVFARGDDGAVYHTYSCYGRGLDRFLTAYGFLDVVPKGRDEDGLSYPMEWIRRRDQYESDLVDLG